MASDRKWIDKAIEHPGSLHRWAKEHGFLTERGTIDIGRAHALAEKEGDTHRLRQINLARTLNRTKP